MNSTFLFHNKQRRKKEGRVHSACNKKERGGRREREREREPTKTVPMFWSHNVTSS